MRAFCTGAVLTSVPIALSGCGSSDSSPSPSPSPPNPAGPTTTVTTTTTTTLDETCKDNQGQCDHCLLGNCLSCKSGYVFDNNTVPGGTCVASCSAPASTPPKPSEPTGHGGIAWPEMCMPSKTSAHFFGIGDWGGDEPGKTWPNPGVAETHGGPIQGPDDHGQWYVARQMKDLASRVDPDFVLNAGDNLYPGGYPDTCGAGQASSNDPLGTFASTKDQIYGGPGMDGKPWLGVLGNHDFGGISMGTAWDQIIFHTWDSDTWRTPAPYWSQRVQYQDFAVQLIFLDTNYNDVGVDPNHNICQAGSGYCWGINDDQGCLDWFHRQNSEGLKMAESVLSNSTAEWHIIVTHYPEIFAVPEIKQLHEQYGIDVIFVGHAHQQSLTQQDNGIVTIISGGGGGVTTDYGAIDTAHGDDDALGFVDFEISRTELKVNMHSWGGCTSCDATEGPAEQNIRASKTFPSHKSCNGPCPPLATTPAPPPAPTCCYGAYAGGCDDYQGDGSGLCNTGGSPPKSCEQDADCADSLLIV